MVSFPMPKLRADLFAPRERITSETECRPALAMIADIVDAACVLVDHFDHEAKPLAEKNLKQAVTAWRKAAQISKSQRRLVSEKVCSKCKLPKPIESFPITTAHGSRYRRSWCQPCLDAYYKSRP